MNNLDPHLTFTAVDSSHLKEVAYDEANETLYVRFLRGKTTLYKYFLVPKKKYKRLLEAESVGAYFARKIKHQYDYEPVA